MMSANPHFNELKQAIEDRNIASVKELLTISVTRIIEPRKSDQACSMDYQTNILSLQAFDIDLTVTEIKALRELLPELLRNRINMEMAMLRAIEEEDLDFVQTLLHDIYPSDQVIGLRRYPSFVKIIEAALAKQNDSIITAILAFPHPNVAIAAKSNDNTHPKLFELMNSLLTQENGLKKHAEWFLYQLPFLLTSSDYNQVTIQERLRIIQSPEIVAKLDYADWEHSTHLLSMTTYVPFLNALLECPKIFSETLDLYRRVIHREHENWQSLAVEALQPFSVLADKIREKMRNIEKASSIDIHFYYAPLLDYYLQSKTKSSYQIQQLLSLEPLQEKMIKSFRTWRTLIFAGHAQYRELLQNKQLLKHFFDSTFATLEDELAELHVECPRIKMIQTAYQSKDDAHEIWDMLNQELPELKKDLVRLDQGLGNVPEVKQLLKNLMHLVASLLTLGIYYSQRKRDLGQCFFKSPILEQKAQLQQTLLRFNQ